MPAQGANIVNAASPKLRHDAVVIGAGAIGLAVAWRAAQRGLRVLVLERERIGAGASHVAAGMLAPVTEATFGEERLTDLGLRSAARWPQFARELAEASGLDPELRACGTLVVARDRDEAEALDREIAFRRSLGLAADRLLGSEARRLEPALAPTIRLGLHAPEDHAVNPRRLTAALAAACAREGVEVREGAAVEEVVTEGGAAAGVRVADACGSDSAAVGGEAASFVAARTVVVAAGSWSGALPGIPEEACVPVRPVKGQVLRLRDPEGPGLLQRSLRMDTGQRSGYVISRGDGRYVLGATVEERGFDTSVTAGALHDLVHDAAVLLPGVLELELEEAVAGLRPGTPDNVPVIGPAAVDGLVWATGHYRSGILLTPLTADALAAILVGDEPPEDIAAADPRRFALPSVPPAPAALSGAHR
ncbi:MAG: glycine oxidase ThiO [Solirubrobacteraceae bacterium]